MPDPSCNKLSFVPDNRTCSAGLYMTGAHLPAGGTSGLLDPCDRFASSCRAHHHPDGSANHHDGHLDAGSLHLQQSCAPGRRPGLAEAPLEDHRLLSGGLLLPLPVPGCSQHLLLLPCRLPNSCTPALPELLAGDLKLSAIKILAPRSSSFHQQSQCDPYLLLVLSYSVHCTSSTRTCLQTCFVVL